MKSLDSVKSFGAIAGNRGGLIALAAAVVLLVPHAQAAPISLSSATGVFLADTAAGGNGTLANTSWPGANSYSTTSGSGFPVLTDGAWGYYGASKWLGAGTDGWGPYPGTAGKGAGFYFTLPTAAPMQTIQFFTEDSSPARSPMTMTIEGSNAGDPLSGSSWTLVYSGATGLATTPDNSAGTIVSFVNATAYTSYRVLFPTTGNPNPGGVQLAGFVIADAPSAATTTTVTRASGTVTPSTAGDSLSFDVSVTGSTPTGTVTLKDGGASGTTIGSATLSGGSCTITNSTLSIGSHANIVAVYGGDGNNYSSTSSALVPAQVVNPGAPAKLAFTTQPGGGRPGETLEPQPVVTVQDVLGNTVDSSASITLAITAGTPTNGGPGILIGTKTLSAVGGVATFTNLSVSAAGVGYKLTATSESLTSADSAEFKVAANMISNGSFERGKAIPLNWNGGAGGVIGVNLSSGPSNTDLPGWSGSFAQWYCLNNVENQTAPDGVRFINLIFATGVQTLSQSFAVVAGTEYTVNYYEKRRPAGGYMDTTLSVATGTVTGVAGTPVAVAAGPAASIVQTTAANADWTLHSFKFTADTTTTATLSFGNHYTPGVTGDNDGAFLDNVSVLPPPGPPAPTGLTARSSNGGTLLEWAASPEATGYIVYRTTTSGEGYGPVGTTSETNYVDYTANYLTDYYYVVSATNSTAVGVFSAEVNIKLPNPGTVMIIY